MGSESNCPMASPHLHNNDGISCVDTATPIQPVDGLLLYVMYGVVLPIIFTALIISMYIVYTRRKNRRELEAGRCNLPTVVWRPRFMHYTTQDESAPDEDDIDWGDDDCITEWARRYLEDQEESTQSNTIQNQNNKKKMGSSAITNILPRMERLKGPYGLYATVYGIQTKVVHVAHPIPARAILTGAGVVDIGSIEESFQTSSGNSGPASSKDQIKRQQLRRRSSSVRMLTGSTKNPAYDHFKNFSGEGVFTANGSDWKAKRASVIHCLLRNGNTEQSLEMEANRAADSFEREVAFAMQSKKSQNKDDNDSSRISPVMNVVPMLQRSTIGLIYRLITQHNVDFSPEDERNMGSSNKTTSASDQLDSLTSSSPRSSAASLASLGGDAEFHSVNEQAKTGVASKDGASINCERDDTEERIRSLLPTYLQSVTKIRMIILAQSRSFWYLVPRWVYRTFSPMYREEERTMGPIREFAQLTCENAAPGSPLAMLSERSSHNVRTKVPGSSVPSNLSRDVLDEAITLLFAGQDTSAATLSWTLHLLSLHPDKQEKLAEEVRSALGNSSKTKPLVLKGMISQLPYLDAVIKESMRLYPVAPFIVRKLTTEITIPADEDMPVNNNTKNKSISMPASTFACIWIYSLHRNPKLWQQPDEFLPERWIDPVMRSRDLGQEEYGAYMPFAIGPRNCLGQPLAHVILRILLTRIMNKYVAIDPKFAALKKLSEADGRDFDPRSLRKDMQAGFTVLPSNGLRVQLMTRI